MIMVVPYAHARTKKLILQDLRKFLAERFQGDCNNEASVKFEIFLVSPTRCYVHITQTRPILDPRYNRPVYTQVEVHERYDLVPGSGVGFA